MKWLSSRLSPAPSGAAPQRARAHGELVAGAEVAHARLEQGLVGLRRHERVLLPAHLRAPRSRRRREPFLARVYAEIKH